MVYGKPEFVLRVERRLILSGLVSQLRIRVTWAKLELELNWLTLMILCSASDFAVLMPIMRSMVFWSACMSDLHVLHVFIVFICYYFTKRPKVLDNIFTFL